MNINPVIIPTFILGTVLFLIGTKLPINFKSPKGKLIFVLALVCSLPGVLISAHYLHLFDDQKWFYSFRAVPYAELTASLSGFLAGLITKIVKSRVFYTFICLCLYIGLSVPYVKMFIGYLDDDYFSERWKGGVCMQSTSSSCGAASSATIFKFYGDNLTEKGIARECFTTQTGTENWYLTRLFRKHGYKVNYKITDGFPDDLKLPAIAGIKIGGVGHFITVLEYKDGSYVTGDPLIGRELVPKENIQSKFDFTGFFMEIQKSHQN